MRTNMSRHAAVAETCHVTGHNRDGHRIPNFLVTRPTWMRLWWTFSGRSWCILCQLAPDIRTCETASPRRRRAARPRIDSRRSRKRRHRSRWIRTWRWAIGQLRCTKRCPLTWRAPRTLADDVEDQRARMPAIDTCPLCDSKAVRRRSTSAWQQRERRRKYYRTHRFRPRSIWTPKLATRWRWTVPAEEVVWQNSSLSSAVVVDPANVRAALGLRQPDGNKSDMKAGRAVPIDAAAAAGPASDRVRLHRLWQVVNLRLKEIIGKASGIQFQLQFDNFHAIKVKFANETIKLDKRSKICYSFYQYIVSRWRTIL